MTRKRAKPLSTTKHSGTGTRAARTAQPSPVIPNFNLVAAQAAIATIRSLDLSTTTVDQLKEQLGPIFTGYKISVPKFSPGLSLFCARIGPKLWSASEFITSAAMPGMLSRSEPLFYCSNSREAVVFELQPKPGDTIVVTEWQSTATLVVNPIGYTKRIFDSSGASRPVPEFSRGINFTSDSPGNPTDALAELFSQALLTSGRDGQNVLTVAIAEILLGSTLLNGIMYPSMRMRADADIFALRSNFMKRDMRLLRAAFLRVDKVLDFGFEYCSLDTAPEVSRGGTIEWYSVDPDKITGMPRRYGTVGWQEFLRQKDSLLNDLDNSRSANSNRPTSTEHGPVAEASFRQWLGACLPGKYGVTSGFVIPDARRMGYTIRHYDVIIFDALNAPVLWVESNADKSEQGRTRAIPAEYVCAVLEIKASLTKKSITDALEKLGELDECRPHLRKNFASAAIFFELRESEQASCSLAEQLFSEAAPGYFGGLILRAGGIDQTVTGYYQLTDKSVATDPEMPLVRKISGARRDEGGGISLTGQGDVISAVPFDNQLNYDVGYTPNVAGVRLLWSYNSFPQFFFDLLARLDGTFGSDTATNRVGYGSSFVR